MLKLLAFLLMWKYRVHGKRCREKLHVGTNSAIEGGRAQTRPELPRPASQPSTPQTQGEKPGLEIKQDPKRSEANNPENPNPRKDPASKPESERNVLAYLRFGRRPHSTSDGRRCSTARVCVLTLESHDESLAVSPMRAATRKPGVRQVLKQSPAATHAPTSRIN